jgi:hemolysin III
MATVPLGSVMETHERAVHEELANAITHGIGFLLSVAGSAWLMHTVMQHGNGHAIAGCAIFAVSMMAVYAASTVSHIVQTLHVRRFFRILDQACIYLMISGTYTPFGMTYLSGGWWWLLMAAMWTVALGGFISKTWFAHRVDAARVWTYVLLGWMPMTAAKPILETVPRGALLWMLYGGVCYTIGTFFLTNDRRRSYFHAVWHVLVIAGTACHFYAIYRFVALGATS